nr:MAG TPA: hypothetical protein [Caudoviricetes sp.]
MSICLYSNIINEYPYDIPDNVIYLNYIGIKGKKENTLYSRKKE